MICEKKTEKYAYFEEILGKYKVGKFFFHSAFTLFESI